MRQRVGYLLSGVAVGAVATALVWWSVSVVVGSNDEGIATEDTAVGYEVAHGELGREVEVPLRAWWQMEPGPTIGRSGVVTSVAGSGLLHLEPGVELLSIDLFPVVVAEGEVPLFRTLAPGAEGPDVAQLQQFLGVMGQVIDDPEGTFGPGTVSAVHAWQRSLGLVGETTGVVEPGDLVFIAGLPRAGVIDDSVQVGAHLGVGAPMLSVLGDAPTFDLIVGGNLRGVVGRGTPVVVRDNGWRGEVTELVDDPDTGAQVARLAARGGGPLCGDDCHDIAVRPGGVALHAMVEVVAPISGAVVPVSAILHGPSGSQVLRHPTGEPIAVEVLAVDGGVAIVEGVEPGVVVRLHVEARDGE